YVVHAGNVGDANGHGRQRYDPQHPPCVKGSNDRARGSTRRSRSLLTCTNKDAGNQEPTEHEEQQHARSAPRAEPNRVVKNHGDYGNRSQAVELRERVSPSRTHESKYRMGPAPTTPLSR